MPWNVLTRRRARSTPHIPSPLAEGAGALDLTVRDPVGLPLPGAQVAVKDAQGRALLSGQTDPYGQFTTTLRPADYQLVITAEGYRPVRTQAHVAPGARTPLPALTLEIAPTPPLPTPGAWQIDPMHSAVRFISRHIGLAEVHGRFNAFEGRLLMSSDPAQSEVEVTIDASSIDTGVQLRDNHLRGPDFLDVQRYPYLHFASDRFIHRGGTRWTVQGALELHGVRRTVSLDTRYLGVGTGIQGETRTACSSTVELHREDFTLNWRKMLQAGIAAIGSSIRVELDIQAVPE